MSNKLLQLHADGWGLVVKEKKSPKLSINHSQTARIVIGCTFKLTKSNQIFERRSVTSPEKLVLK